LKVSVALACVRGGVTLGVTTEPPDPVLAKETHTAPALAPLLLGCQLGSGVIATNPPGHAPPPPPPPAVQVPIPAAESKGTAGASEMPNSSSATAKARTPAAFFIGSISSGS